LCPQDNYVRHLSMKIKSFSNYFESPTKLVGWANKIIFLDLYLAKFSNTLVKLFFLCTFVYICFTHYLYIHFNSFNLLKLLHE